MTLTFVIHRCRRAARLALLLLVLNALTACTQVPAWLVAPQPADFAPLQYFAWLEQADTQALSAERQRLSINERSSLAPDSTVQLAMLLSVPEDTTGADWQQARSLLAPLLQAQRSEDGKAQSDYRIFASLWEPVLAQREGAGKTRQNQQQALRQTQTMSKRIQALEQQIEALTTIEQQLKLREQAPVQP